MFRSSKLFLVVLIAMIFATSAFAFAAGINNMPATSYAGEGVSLIGSFDLSNLDYAVNAGNPSTISAVNFTLAPTAVNVQASLDNGATFVTCDDGVSSGTNWSCPFAVDVNSASGLVIVASDQ